MITWLWFNALNRRGKWIWPANSCRTSYVQFPLFIWSNKHTHKPEPLKTIVMWQEIHPSKTMKWYTACMSETIAFPFQAHLHVYTPSKQAWILVGMPASFVTSMLTASLTPSPSVVSARMVTKVMARLAMVSSWQKVAMETYHCDILFSNRRMLIPNTCIRGQVSTVKTSWSVVRENLIYFTCIIYVYHNCTDAGIICMCAFPPCFCLLI